MPSTAQFLGLDQIKLSIWRFFAILSSNYSSQCIIQKDSQFAMQAKKIALTSLVLISSLVFSFSAHSGQSGVYRWSDDQGNTHYSDKPPKGVESEFIKATTGKVSDNPEEANGNKTAEQQAAALPESMEVLPEKDPTICTQAKANLEALSGRPRIRIKEADGSHRFLNEEEKETQRELARKNMEVHCN
jgi:hypothetical protein